MLLNAHWCTKQRFLRVYPQDFSILSWLVNPKSMTAKMKRYSPLVEIDVLSHAMALITRDEARYLGVDAKRRVSVREIVMKVDGVTWLYARTLLATDGLFGDAKRLLRPSKVPLGKYLFRQPGISRSEFQLAVLSDFPGIPEPVLARRSRFEFGAARISLSEVFLPAMVQKISGDRDE